MSDQNPVHRDGVRRDDGEQPYTDARQTLAENEERVRERAPFPDDGSTTLTHEECRKLDEDAAANRLDDVGKAVLDTKEGGRHGN